MDDLKTRLETMDRKLKRLKESTDNMKEAKRNHYAGCRVNRCKSCQTLTMKPICPACEGEK